MNQFDVVMARLQEIVHTQNMILKETRLIREILEDATIVPGEATLDMKNSLFGEDPFDEQDYRPAARVMDNADGGNLESGGEVLRPQMPGVTRTRVEVRNANGELTQIPLAQLPDVMVKLIREHVRVGAWFQLYERDTDGQIMFAGDDAVINSVRRGQPHDDRPDAG